MARMIPAVVDPGHSPPGEVKVFELLEHDAPGDWTVLHSLDIPRHIRQIEGELDFLIIVPERGVVCLEIKSHKRIRRDNDGIWQLGNDDPTARSPFKQASEAMHSVRRRLSGHAGLSCIPFVSLVGFTHCIFDVPGTEWEPWQVFDEISLGSMGISAVIERCLANYREKLSQVQTAVWFDESAAEPTSMQCDQIVRALRPSFERVRSPKARKAEAAGEIRRFTEEQFGALDAMEENSRLIFTGAAGTGKTFIAIEATRRSVLTGKTVLLCCFNRLLGDWLRTECASLGPNAKVGTLHSIMLDITGNSPPIGASDGYWSRELPSAAAHVLLEGHKMSGTFDALVIDEAQDICTPEYLDVLDLLLSGGLRTGACLAFGDFQFQNIFGDGVGSDGRGELRRRMDAAAYSLRTNCRNRPRIGSIASSAFGSSPYSKYLRPDDGVEVIVRSYDGPEEQSRELAKAIDAIRGENFQLGDIAILSQLAGEAACHSLSAPYSAWMATATSKPIAKIRTSTVHAFKGMEAPAVVVTDVTKLADVRSRQLIYIAATRSTERLVILIDRNAVPELQALIIGSI